MADKPSVLFVCVHNAGRSQMAAGYLNQLSGGRIRSAGSEPGDLINPVAVLAMAEEGIDIAAEQPKLLTTDAVKASEVVITMGCGDTCPYYPGRRYEDWELDDPAGQDIQHVRPIRDEIRRLVERLISQLHRSGHLILTDRCRECPSDIASLGRGSWIVQQCIARWSRRVSPSTILCARQHQPICNNALTAPAGPTGNCCSTCCSATSSCAA